MKETFNETAWALRCLAGAIEERKAITLRLAGEAIYIPADARIKAEYESGAGEKEVMIRVAWDSGVGVPEVVHRHSDQVKDSHGHIYDVFIYGEPRADDTWEGWIEFLPINESLLARRTGRETTQSNRAALAYWATGLEPLYIAGAFERAI
jgi:hypothetical protein